MDSAALKARFVAFAAAVWGWFLAGIKLLTAFIGVVLTVAIAVIVTAWIVVLAERQLPASEKVAIEQKSQFRAVEIAHDSIKTWVLHCVGANSIRELPKTFSLTFTATLP